jgi:hypothetical protein
MQDTKALDEHKNEKEDDDERQPRAALFTFTRALQDEGNVRQVISIVATDVNAARAQLLEHIQAIDSRSGRRLLEYALLPPFVESSIDLGPANPKKILPKILVSMFTHI